MPGLLNGKRKRVVDSVSVGCTPKRLKEEVQTMVIKFHDFASLIQKRDEPVLSPSVRAFGYKWKFQLFPLGHKTSSETTECISCYMQHIGDDTVFAKCSFRCKDSCRTFNKMRSFALGHSRHGFKNYLNRKDVLENYLDEDGTLIIEVDMQIAVDKENDDVWYPKFIPNDVLTQLYHSSSEDDTNIADVAFDVDGRKFLAHKNILSVRSPPIFELMKDNNNNTTDNEVVVVPIPNMESEIFEGVLKFVYCVEKPTIEDKSTATKYLLAADRLGIIDLKMFVESTIVEKFLDTSNAAEMLILSDSHSCPLLKEATLKLYDTDASAVMESEGWSQLEESPRLLVEILKFCKVKQQSSASVATAVSNNRKNVGAVIEDVANMDVTSLRVRLFEANLDIDGNQEILIARLKDHHLSRNSTRNNIASSSAAVIAATAAVAANPLPPPQRQLRPRRQPRR